MLDNITASINLARAGQIKGLAVTSAKPSALAPDFPTVAETVHGFDVASFHDIGGEAVQHRKWWRLSKGASSQFRENSS